jgi:PAS domain S-box-containing protein
MDKENRKSGIPVVGDIPWGTHFCQFYQTKQDLIETLVPYFQAGLKNNEFCMWVTADDLTVAEGRKAMVKAIKGFSTYIKKGQIEILPYTEWYLKEGSFDSGRVLDGWVEKLNQALKKGYAGLRLTGNTFWLEKKDRHSFADYEETVNNVIGNYKMVALCTYSLEKCSAAEIVDVIRNHEFALIKKNNKWEIFESSRYKNTKEALVDSEKRFRLALRNAPITVAAQDRDLKFLWAYNQRTRRPEDVVGKTDFDIFPKKDADNLVALKRRVIDTGSVINEKMWITSGGKKLYLDLFLEPIKDKSGNITGVEIATVDLTSQKLAEEKLQESENKYRNLFENMSEGLALCEMIYDENGAAVDYRFLNINPVFEKFIGLTNDRIAGKTAREVLPNVQPKAIEIFGKVVKAGKPVQFENYSRDLNKWFDVFVYRAQPGQFAYMVVDITPRKQAEDALKESEEHFRALSEASPVIISVTRISDGTILYVNNAYTESLGYRQEDLIGKKALNVYFDPAERDAMIKKLNEQGFLNNYEIRVKKGDGTSFWASSTVRFTNFNRERALIAASLDISGLVTAEVEKRKLADSVQQEKDRLSALVNSIPDEVWFADTKKNFTLANPSALREFGYEKADAIDIEAMANSLEVLRPDGTPRPADEAPPLRALKGKIIRNQEEMIRTPATGELRYRQVNAAPVKDTNGNIIGSVSVVRDITEQKKAEEQQAYLASFPAMNPMQIIELDREGKINYCNPSTLELFPDLLKKGKRHPYLTGLTKKSLKIKAAGNNVISRDIKVNERYYEQVICTVGENLHIRIYGQDITERKKAEDNLRAAQRSLEEAQRIARLGSWEWNVRTGELRWSKELFDIYGVQADSFTPTMELFADFIHPDDRDNLNTVMNQLISGGQAVDLDFRIILHDKSIRYLHATSAVSSFDENGKGLVYIGTTQDITERKHLDEVLQIKERRFRILSEINSLLLTSREPEQVIQVIAEKVMEYLHCDTFFNFIIDESSGKLNLNAYAGIPAETAQKIEWLDFGTAICGCVARDNSPIVSVDVQHNGDERAALVRSFGIKAYASYPLHIGNEVIGTVSFGTRNRTVFTDDELNLVEIVAAQISVAMQRKKVEENLKSSEERFYKAFHVSPVALSISRISDGMFVDINRSFLQLFGYTREELVGEKAIDLNIYDNQLERREIVRRLQQEKKVINYEVTARTKNGNKIQALTSAEIIELNSEPHIIWTTIDITDRKNAEESLKESEERFSKAFHSSPLGMVITDLPEGRFVDVNDSFLRLTEFTREDVLNHTSAEFNLYVDPHDREQVWQTILEKGNFENSEMTWRTKTGKLINVISSNEKFSLQGQDHAIFMVIDITERKKAEKEVIALNRELRAISECDQIIVHAKNENTLFSDVCRTLCTTAGYRLVWVGAIEHDENKTVRPVAWFGNDKYVRNANITWADTPRGQGPSGLAARTGKTHYFQDFATAPAAAPWREAALSLGYRSSIALPLFNSSGAVFGVFTLYSAEPNYFNPAEIRLLEELAGDISFGVGALQEKSEREQAESLLRETTNYLNNLFDYANAPIIVWDPQFRITRFNHAFERLTGIKAADAIGKPLDILFPEDTKTESLNYINQTTSGEHWEVVEISIQSKDGERHTVLWNSATLFDVDGNKMVATIAQGQDITERKKAEEEVKQLNEELKRRAAELEASNKELEAFSYSVSHDLRAPLRSITGFSAVLLEDYREKLDEEGKLYLKKIQDSGELMGQLIDDLLKLSRVTRIDIYYEKIDLTDIAQNVVDELAQDEPKRKVKINLAPDLIAYGDRNLLRLVLQNLLGNAWKYSSKTAEPQIEMGTMLQDGKQVYFVRDNGVGFDMAYAHKLFQPFQRLHRATEFAGTGIGLATVQRIVRRHGGKVWAESKVGEGATFFFTLN